MVEDILTIMMDHLQPGGVFSYVRYAGLSRLRHFFGTSSEQAQLCARQSIIDRFAKRYQIGQRLVWANIPPTWVHYWRKSTDAVENPPYRSELNST
jgi:hypothetical protein